MALVVSSEEISAGRPTEFDSQLPEAEMTVIFPKVVNSVEDFVKAGLAVEDKNPRKFSNACWGMRVLDRTLKFTASALAVSYSPVLRLGCMSKERRLSDVAYISICRCPCFAVSCFAWKPSGHNLCTSSGFHVVFQDLCFAT